MARVTVEDCVDKVPNRFDLVMLAAHRAREISSGSPITVDRDNDKNPVVSLREIADETQSSGALKERLIELIGREAEYARAGRPAAIWAKMVSALPSTPGAGQRCERPISRLSNITTRYPSAANAPANPGGQCAMVLPRPRTKISGTPPVGPSSS